MKTTTLTDALARATKGPCRALSSGSGAEFTAIDTGRTGPVFSIPASREVIKLEAALLAHCRNTLPGLVEAAQELVNELKESGFHHSLTDTLREALRAAQEVKVP